MRFICVTFRNKTNDTISEVNVEKEGEAYIRDWYASAHSGDEYTISISNGTQP